jgi:hypothetical protein
MLKDKINFFFKKKILKKPKSNHKAKISTFQILMDEIEKKNQSRKWLKKQNK